MPSLGPGPVDRKTAHHKNGVENLNQYSTIDVGDILEDSKIPVAVGVSSNDSSGSDTGSMQETATTVVNLGQLQGQLGPTSAFSQNHTFNGGATGTDSKDRIVTLPRTQVQDQTEHLNAGLTQTPSPVSGGLVQDSVPGAQGEALPQVLNSITFKPVVLSCDSHQLLDGPSPRKVCPNVNITSNLDLGFGHFGTPRNQPPTPSINMGHSCTQPQALQTGQGATCRLPVTRTHTTNIPLASIVKHAKRIASPQLDNRVPYQCCAPPCKIQVLDVTCCGGVRVGPGGDTGLSSRGGHCLAAEDVMQLQGLHSAHCLVESSPAHYSVSGSMHVQPESHSSLLYDMVSISVCFSNLLTGLPQEEHSA